MIPVGTAVGYLSLDYSQFSRNLKTAVGEATSLSGKFSDTLGKGLQTVGNQISSVGKTLTYGLTVPLGIAAASSVKFGSEFDKQMSSVQSVSNASTEDLNKMRDAAISWGEKTVYSATEAGEALYYMGLAGWEPQKSIAALGSVLNLAAAGDLELGRTSDIVTDAMTAMGYEAGELTKGIENTAYFTNSLAAAMSNSNTDVDLMGETFKYVSPLAGALGMDISDLTLAVGLMANVGVKGSQAGTGLRQALKNLIEPTDEAEAAMKTYGVSLFDANGKAKDMRTFMEELRGTFNDLKIDIYDANGEVKSGEQIMEEYGHSLPTSQQEKLNAIVKIFGTRALPGILGIIEQSDEKFNNLADAIDNSNEAFVLHNGTVYTMKDALAQFGEQAVRSGEDFEILGAAEGMAMMQMDNLQGDWIRFTSALGTSKIMITDLVKNSLREFIQKLTDLVKWFNSLDEEQKKHILKIAATIAAIGPLLFMFGSLISGIGNVIIGFQKMMEAFNLIKTGSIMLVTKFKNIFEAVKLAKAGFTGFAAEASPLGAAIGSLSAPILAVIAVIALLVAAFVHLWNTNEEFKNNITNTWDGIVAKFDEAGKKILDAINSLGFDFTSLGEAIYAAWDWICTALAPIITEIFASIGRTIGGIVDIVVGIVQTIVGLINGFKDGDWSLFIEGIKSIWDGFWALAIEPFVATYNVITEYLSMFGLTWTDVWNGIKEFFLGIWNTIKEFFIGVWNTLVGIVTGKIEEIRTTITNVMNIIKYVKENGWNGIKNIVLAVWENMKEKITTTLENIKNVVTNVMNAIKTIKQTVWNIVVSLVKAAVENIKNFIFNSFENIKNDINTVMIFIQTLLQNAWSTITTFVTTTVENLKNSVIQKFEYLKSTVITTIENLKTNVTSKVTELKQKFTDTVEELKNKVIDKFNEMKEKVIEAVKKLKEEAVKKMKECKEAILKVWDDIKEKFEKVGNNIVEGIKSGIEKAWKGLTEWLVKKKEALLSSLGGGGGSGNKNSASVHSQSFGNSIVNGMSTGFENSLPAAIDNMEDTLNYRLSKFNVDDINIKDLSNSFKSVVTDIADWFTSVEERLALTVDNIRADLTNLIGVGQLIVNPDGTISGIIMNKPSESLSVSKPGIDRTESGEVINNFTFYSNKSIDEIEAAKLLKETQRDLAEGYL